MRKLVIIVLICFEFIGYSQVPMIQSYDFKQYIIVRKGIKTDTIRCDSIYFPGYGWFKGSNNITWNKITNKPTTLSGYGITDGMNTSHAANSITSTNISNWNTAYGWGNHAGLYRPISYVPSWSEITSRPSFATVATSGNYNDLSNKPTLFDGTWSSLSGKPSFAAVATSGSYTDLSNKPSLFDGTWSSLSGKPLFSTVATSGSYQDLTNKLPITGDNQIAGSISISTNTYHYDNGVISATSDNDNIPLSARSDGNSDCFVILRTNNNANLINAYTTTGHSFVVDGLGQVSADSIQAKIGYAYTPNWIATVGQAGYIRNKPTLFDGTWSSLSGKPSFATVATSGNYNDLSNKPTLFDGTWSSLSGKPLFSTVATSGSYTDLSNKPSIPSGVSSGSATTSAFINYNGTSVTNGQLFGGTIASVDFVSSFYDVISGLNDMNYGGRFNPTKLRTGTIESIIANIANPNINIVNDVSNGTAFQIQKNNITTLQIFSDGVINQNTTIESINGSTSGSIECSEDFVGSSYKTVVIYCNNLYGSATYNFPVLFSHPPTVLGIDASLTITSKTTGLVTISAAGTSGTIVLGGR